MIRGVHKMKDVKCVCGHINPQGTVLCESCGLTLIEENVSEALLDMRYEGSARRSQTYKKPSLIKYGIFSHLLKLESGLLLLH